MPFPFTFKLSVPGLTNPFYTPAQSAPIPPNPNPVQGQSRSRVGTPRQQEQITRRRPSPVPSCPSALPLSRKRGWEPSFAEPSQSTTTLASSSGYLDTPAKYREMAAASSGTEFHGMEDMAATELPPPAKRRRGLAGSIVSTALSAALIGTAVGLTVYRLWRDRGKEPEQLPPPPYQQGGWTPIAEPQTIQVTPPTPRSRKTRHPTGSASKRPTVHHRRPRVRAHAFTPPPRSSSPALFPPPQPEFDFGHTDHTEEVGIVEDQMDWIGGKLSMLIEEGKKALGKEIVVMSDAKEDEVDDGTGAWEEDDAPSHSQPTASISRSGSLKRAKRPRNLALPPPSYAPPSLSTASSSSAYTSRFEIQGGTSPMATPHRGHGHTRGMSVDSGLNASTSFKEDERAWESPELRESMEKARARYLQNRGS